MFGGPGAPPSEEEIKAQEQIATSTIQQVIATSVILYLSPMAISFVKDLF